MQILFYFGAYLSNYVRNDGVMDIKLVIVILWFCFDIAAWIKRSTTITKQLNYSKSQQVVFIRSKIHIYGVTVFVVDMVIVVIV